MATWNPAQEVFDVARKEFLRDLKNPSQFDFSKFKSINDVYDTTDQIQEEQGKTGDLRYLRKIQPYLEGLKQYVAVIDIFVQSKAEILALIWVGVVL